MTWYYWTAIAVLAIIAIIFFILAIAFIILYATDRGSTTTVAQCTAGEACAEMADTFYPNATDFVPYRTNANLVTPQQSFQNTDGTICTNFTDAQSIPYSIVNNSDDQIYIGLGSFNDADCPTTETPVTAYLNSLGNNFNPSPFSGTPSNGITYTSDCIYPMINRRSVLYNNGEIIFRTSDEIIPASSITYNGQVQMNNPTITSTDPDNDFITITVSGTSGNYAITIDNLLQ